MKEIIEEYLYNNHLSTEEETNMEQKIIREGFDFIERRASWKAAIESSFADIENEEGRKKPALSLTRYVVIVSAICLFALGGYMFWQQFYKKTPPQTNKHQDYKFDKDQIVADASTRADKLLSLDIEGFQANVVRKGEGDAGEWQADFQAEKYGNVIRALEALGRRRTAEQTFYLAEAYLKMNPRNTEKAQPLLKIVADSDNLYSKDALWSYALICVLNQQNEAAKQALDKVKVVSNAHGEEAQKLREALK